LLYRLGIAPDDIEEQIKNCDQALDEFNSNLNVELTSCMQAELRAADAAKSHKKPRKERGGR
jgi:hypothetical protein